MHRNERRRFTYGPNGSRLAGGEEGRVYAQEVGEHFRNLQGDIIEIGSSAAPRETWASRPKFKLPRFNRTISQWLNMVMERGFILEGIEEPRPRDETVRRHPRLQAAQVVACFLHVRARKPGAGLRYLCRPTLATQIHRVWIV